MLAVRDIDLARTKSAGGRNTRAEFYLGRDVESPRTFLESEYWLRRCAYDRKPGDKDEHRFFGMVYLGDNLRKQQRVDEAIKIWWDAHELYPDARESLMRIGLTAYRMADAAAKEKKETVAFKWWNACLKAYEKALPLTSKPCMIMFIECSMYAPETTDELRWRLAIAWWKTGKAAEHVNRALELVAPIENPHPALQESIKIWEAHLEALKSGRCAAADESCSAMKGPAPSI